MQTVKLALLALLFALPIIFFPFTYLAFELPKVLLLYLVSIFTIYVLVKSGYNFGNLTKVHWLYLIFFFWMIANSLFGLSFGQSFLGSYFRWQGILSWFCYSLLFFISGKLFADSHFRKHICIAVLIASLFTASIAIVQFSSRWFLGNTSQLLYSGRVISTFGQPNFLGAYLVMSLPFVWFIFKQVKYIQRILVSLSVLVIVLGIFATLSRSAYLGLLILAIIWGFYHYRLLLTNIIFSIILFAILANLYPELVFSQWQRFQVDTISYWTAENRLVIGQKSIQLILQRPLTGYGLENFALAFPATVGPNDLGLKDIVVDSSHNLFLDLTAQMGLVGLGLFLTIVVLSIITGLKRLKTADIEHRDFIKAAISAVIAFIVVHQFSVISIVPMVVFWVCLGSINGSAIEYFGLPKLVRYTINTVGIALIFITVLFIIQTIRADMLFRQASAYEVSDIKKAINLDSHAMKLAPWIQFYSLRRNFLLKQLGYHE